MILAISVNLRLKWKGIAMSLTDQISTELIALKRQDFKSEILARIISSYYPIVLSYIGLEGNQQSNLTHKNNLPKNFLSECKRLHSKISDRLNKTYPDKVKTNAEKVFINKLKDNSRLQFLSSIWIGNRNVDIFIPSIANKAVYEKPCMQGLAIELNGAIHNTESKMGKDESLANYLRKLQIGVVTFDSDSIHQIYVDQFIRNLAGVRRLDSRSRNRVMLRVYLSTIIKNATHGEISNLFNIPIKVISTVGGDSE